jgi:hypothetical protein
LLLLEVLIIGVTCGDQVIDDARQLMGGRHDRLRTAGFRPHAPVEIARRHFAAIYKVCAASRRAVAARLLTLRAAVRSITPPLTSFGQAQPQP